MSCWHRIYIARFPAAFAIASLFVTGCASDKVAAPAAAPVVPVTAQPVVTTVSVDAPATILLVGDSVQLTSVSRDASSHLVNISVVWRSTDTTIATVNTSGLVRTRSAGLVTITASVGDVSGAVKLSAFTVTALLIAGPRVFVPGSEGMLAGAAVFSAIRTARPVATTFFSSDTSIARVTADGRITVTGTGTFTVIASARGLTQALQVISRPLGGTIAFLRSSRSGSYPALLALDGSNVTDLPIPSVHGNTVAISPNGKRLAYECGATVCWMEIATGAIQTIGIAGAAEPSWTGDSHFIAARVPGPSILVLGVDTAASRSIKTAYGAAHPRIAQDGRSVLHDCNVSDPYDEDADVCVSAFPGPPGQILLSGQLRGVLSPDGARVAGVAGDYVCVTTMAARDCSTRFAPGGRVTEIAWSPDGAHLLVAASGQLWLADANGENLVRLIKPSVGFSVESPSWGGQP